MFYAGLVVAVGCLVTIVVQIAGLGYGLEISTSGSWWTISVLGMIGGLLVMDISAYARR